MGHKSTKSSIRSLSVYSCRLLLRLKEMTLVKTALLLALAVAQASAWSENVDVIGEASYEGELDAIRDIIDLYFQELDNGNSPAYLFCEGEAEGGEDNLAQLLPSIIHGKGELVETNPPIDEMFKRENNEMDFQDLKVNHQEPSVVHFGDPLSLVIVQNQGMYEDRNDGDNGDAYFCILFHAGVDYEGHVMPEP